MAMYRAVHAAGTPQVREDGENEAPAMETLVALRVSIALMHGRKHFPGMIRNRFVRLLLSKLLGCLS